MIFTVYTLATPLSLDVMILLLEAEVTSSTFPNCRKPVYGRQATRSLIN